MALDKKYFFGWENIKTVIKDLYETWSAKTSKLSSKRIERTVFTVTAVGLTIGCFIYLWIHQQLTATETVILTGSLLIAGGYNMSQTQKEKKDNGLTEGQG